MVSPLRRALIALGLLGLWFGWLGPSLAETLSTARAVGRVEPGYEQMASALASARRSLLPSGEAAARWAELLRLAATEAEIERAWTARAAVVLDPSQRLDPGASPAAPRSRSQPWLDPELSLLIDALSRAHGWQATRAPDVPPYDPWPGVEPRRRMTALRIQAQTLAPEAALTIEGLAIDAAVAAARRSRAEAELRAALGPDLLATAAAAPGDPEHVHSAIAALLARSR